MKKYIKPNLLIYSINVDEVLFISLEKLENFYEGEEVDLWKTS